MKIDIDISKNADGIFDISFSSDGDFTTTEGYDTAVKMSIFCERRANKDEISSAILRRGWIGNTLDDKPGNEIGSKLWLNYQARMTNQTISSIIDSIEDGTLWFVEDKLLQKIVVSTVQTDESVGAFVDLYNDNSRVDSQYYDVWRATGT